MGRKRERSKAVRGILISGEERKRSEAEEKQKKKREEKQRTRALFQFLLFRRCHCQVPSCVWRCAGGEGLARGPEQRGRLCFHHPRGDSPETECKVRSDSLLCLPPPCFPSPCFSVRFLFCCVVFCLVLFSFSVQFSSVLFFSSFFSSLLFASPLFLFSSPPLRLFSSVSRVFCFLLSFCSLLTRSPGARVVLPPEPTRRWRELRSLSFELMCTISKT